MKQLTEGIDYTILPDGRLVFTAHYLTERGFCCGKGCSNCPYDYMNVEEQQRTILLNNRQEQNG